jgi:hypothetical protein
MKGVEQMGKRVRQWAGRLALMVTGAGPALASAGGVATVEVRAEGEVQQVVYEFKGDQLRMGMPGGMEGYMLFTGGVPYMVMTGEQTMVLDLRQSMAMVGSMVKMEAPGTVDGFVSLTPTGRRETVAGIPGEVFQLVTTEDGQRTTREMVLSNDARARKFSEAMLTFGKAMAQLSGVGANDAEFDKALGNRGMLRMGSEFQLVRYEDRTPGDDRFRLPAPPTQLPNLEGLFGGGAGAGAGAQGGAGINLGELFGGRAERQQQRVEQRTDQEIDQATDSAVDKVLDKTFKKIFGR